MIKNFQTLIESHHNYTYDEEHSQLGRIQFSPIPPSSELPARKKIPEKKEPWAAGLGDPMSFEVVQGFHIADLIIWLMQVVAITIFAVGLHAIGNKFNAYLLGESLSILGAFLFIIFTIMALLRIQGSQTATYLKGLNHDMGVHERVDEFRNATPKLQMEICCYHFETRTRVASTGTEGHTSNSATVTYQEKVVTFLETKDFPIQQATDLSGKIPRTHGAHLVKLLLDLEVFFADFATKDIWDQEEQDFVEENKYKDTYFEYKRIITLPNMEPKMMSLVSAQEKPIFLGYNYFLLSHAFLMQYLYIMWIRLISVKVAYKIQKAVARTQQ